MTTQDPSFPERPDRDERPGDEGRSGGSGWPPAPPPSGGYGPEPGRGMAPRNGLGTAALACGIIAIVLSLIPAINLFTWPLGVLAIVFGGVGWSRANKGQATNKGQAITGLVLGIASFLAFCLIYMILSMGSSDYYDYGMALPF